ncbi:hypothetical protein [Pseudolactococcus paracarnosus]|uniref:Uncharacterized protein n=1 Tax=Pseudolactococcus paracarnosus TaxID=2749962 RepID=A0A7L4WE49_9LACT|nr:hypothetical protein [Lactococcus paracarnosus]SPC36010.1 conserved hypothetical protein [Lactococcus piscium]MCJ1976652.1 hypothetical protein [Lactococcus paracarnosus]MCJ1982557.1 hypothetical protein [Lactococcus paracarnosus]MCJ1993578.1 hypothetical protein [Lactococcus paracarnosus]MCJ1998716.1 hypothetical protein [Lactococcus paracarnosus]
MANPFEHNRLTLAFPDQLGQLVISDLLDVPVDSGSVAHLYFKGTCLVMEKGHADRVLSITLPDDIDPAYVTTYLLGKNLPTNQSKIIKAYLKQISPFLDRLGYTFTSLADDPQNASKPKATAKAQHRFSKTLVDSPFYVDYDGAKAEIFWMKRQELVIKKGASLKQEIPLNKDGSVGFSQKFALTLRQEHADAIGSDFKTTADIHLKSVNEVGHLLFFAGTNAWLILKDKTGKTLDSHTIVK